MALDSYSVFEALHASRMGFSGQELLADVQYGEFFLFCTVAAGGDAWEEHPRKQCGAVPFVSFACLRFLPVRLADATWLFGSEEELKAAAVAAAKAAPPDIRTYFPLVVKTPRKPENQGERLPSTHWED